MAEATAAQHAAVKQIAAIWDAKAVAERAAVVRAAVERAAAAKAAAARC
jgi:hypothetical protein